MSNHLVHENSPYLLQHKDNPVDWYPWVREALEKAESEDKPIFLSIGYAACHWCHVMAHESFEDSQTAAIMNDHFINIKVDREERPDLDSIYMNAVVAMTGQGGWPMSVFLSPAGEPFFGGTYFPPIRRNNMPAFKEVLLTIARLWREDREKLLASAQQIIEHLKQTQTIESPAARKLERANLDQAAYRLAQAYDWKNGGWGQAPKFPQPMAIEFLLRRAAQGDKMALEIAVHALDAMSQGGMYDILGGGFARYSTDDLWLVPHFEKMLYDNALLARVYLYAHLVTGDGHYLNICRSTLDFIDREMTDPGAGFYSSLDADSEGEEGKFYTWGYDEIVQILKEVQSQSVSKRSGDLDWSELFSAAFGITRAGNFEGKIVLRRHLNDEELADRFQIEPETVVTWLNEMNNALLDYRNQRIFPGIDDKCITAWNGWATLAFAEAARYLGDPKYLKIAQKNASFLIQNLYLDKRLKRSWRKGEARHDAYLEDYASLILALLALYQTDHDPDWYRRGKLLTEDMIDLYYEAGVGFYDTGKDGAALLIRPKDLQDNATPSGGSQAAMALLQMAHYTGNSNWREIAEESLAIIQSASVRYPTAFSNWLCALDFALAEIKEIAIVFPLNQSEITSFTKLVWNKYAPNFLLAVSKYPLPPDIPELLLNRVPLDNHVTTYVCRDFSCNLPTNTLDGLQSQLFPDS